MRWDFVKESNQELKWSPELLRIRKGHRALRIGGYAALDSQKLLAFSRTTDCVADTVIVACNPTDLPVKEVLSTRDSRLMNWGQLKDAIDGAAVTVMSGLIEIEVPARTVRLLVPAIGGSNAYTPYKRIG